MSADIAVPEHERVVRFYTQILGTGAAPLWREDLTNNRGVPVIGVGVQSSDYGDLPVQWMPHIQVADVAQSARRAVELGGSELLHGRADDGTSQWAVLLDSDGAAFGLIPVVSSAPEEDDASRPPATRLGCIAWLELTVPDAAAARDFYREVVGSSVRAGVGEGEADYLMLGGDGEPAAGIRSSRGDHTDLPRAWLLHLPVGDLAESLRRVRAQGGKVLLERAVREGGLAAAVVQDPVGACVTLVPA